MKLKTYRALMKELDPTHWEPQHLVQFDRDLAALDIGHARRVLAILFPHHEIVSIEEVTPGAADPKK